MPMIELLATIADTIGLDGFAFVKAGATGGADSPPSAPHRPGSSASLISPTIRAAITTSSTGVSSAGSNPSPRRLGAIRRCPQFCARAKRFSTG